VPGECLSTGHAMGKLGVTLVQLDAEELKRELTDA
jgi:hypothetical protein